MDSGDVQMRVDIKKVFASKNPKLAKLLPGFVFRYLKKIIHEDFVNDFMDKHGDKYGIDFADAAIKEFNVKIKVRGADNIKKEGRYIFAANHPLGGFDGIISIHLLLKMGFEVKVLVNDILMNVKNLDPLFIPLNKHGGQAKDLVKTIDEAYDSDGQIMTFPSGFVSRRIKGKITDLTWQKSFVMKSKKYHRDVVPIHFSGRNSSFFYNLHTIRKFLGIKANLEMFYLMDETYKHRNKKITVTIGKPIPYKTFDNRMKPLEWAEKVKEHVYKVAEYPIANFEF